MSILIYLTNEITDEDIIACNKNRDTRMINVYTLFNMNADNEEIINEQKNIKDFFKEQNIVFPVYYKRLEKIKKKLHFYITKNESNVIFLFCERDQTYLMCLQTLVIYRKDLVISFTEQLQKLLKIERTFVMNQYELINF
tara:strand:+ start:1348 stop:1767 length:420 start_codon:yes stop_codon:yes gene_type:complete